MWLNDTPCSMAWANAAPTAPDWLTSAIAVGRGAPLKEAVPKVPITPRP